MKRTPSRTVLFKQGHFVTHLPVDYHYTRSHFWAEARPEDCWRLGFTRFATRMLGEMVDHKFETAPGAPVSPGQVLGWVEGFKAISDVLCVGEGVFLGSNPALSGQVELVTQSNYTEGWLYEMKGLLEQPSLDVDAYAAHLKATIDRILEKQRADEADLSAPAAEW